MEICTSTEARVTSRKAFIVGGGVMGLMAAIELARLSRLLGTRLEIFVFEAGAFGGGPGDRTAARRCQLWIHTEGTIYASTQPAVSLALQCSTRHLRRLVPYAFRFPLALAIETAGMPKHTGDCFRVLGITHEPVPGVLVHDWFPALNFPAGAHVFRVRDGTIDLRLLGHGLTAHARRVGIRLVRQGIRRFDLHAGQVCALHAERGGKVKVSPHDVVVLACGAQMRPLLTNAGIRLPGLRLFRSHLVASDAFGIPALLAFLQGGVNCVPHDMADGLVNIFGNSARTELPPESDREPVQSDATAIAKLCAEVEANFGLRIPSNRLAWPAVKTEIVLEGVRSQAHHARLITGISNLWMAIPGKLSQTAACAMDLAAKILREGLGTNIARPIWESQPVEESTPLTITGAA
jgi:glycine/D-amino acid oxidase-like deaminating enzyme